jgi:hypothetical protein
MVSKTGADTTIKAYHAGCRVWVPAVEKKGHVPKTPVLYGNQGVSGWVEGQVTRVVELGDGDGLLDVQAEDGRLLKGLKPNACLLQNDSSDIVEDLVDSDFLHEPGSASPSHLSSFSCANLADHSPLPIPHASHDLRRAQA